MGTEGYSGKATRWFERISNSDHMLWGIGVFSFLETIIIPVPIELLLIPLMMANRERLWLLAAVTTAGCLVAALVGYGVGLALYQSVGEWFINWAGMEDKFEAFRDFFDQYGFMAILVIGIIPIPFQLAMITAGMSGYPIYLFVLAAIIARGIRYFGLAWLVWKFGDKSRDLWQRHAVLASLVAGVVLVSVSFGLQMVADKVLSSA